MRVAVFALGGPILLYLAAATVFFLFVYFGQRVVSVSFLDLVVPSRWGYYRMALGNRDVADAQKSLGQGRRLEALLLVRTGVAYSPANRDGRLLLAQLLVEAGRSNTAQQVLLEGLKFHADDPAYLQSLLAFLLREQQDARVVALAQASLARSRVPDECQRLFALAAATASYFRGNYDRADDFLHAEPRLPFSRDGRLLEARIGWERGYCELALLQLRALASELPDDSEIHAELVTRLGERDRPDEARRLSLGFQIAHPALPGPRIELLHAYHRAGERDRVAREAAALLRDFPADATALLTLADFAADTGDVTLARRVADQARSHNLPPEAHAILVVESLIVARDYRAALDTTRALLHDNPGWDTRYATLLGSLQAIAHYGLGDTEAAQLFLSNFLNHSDLRVENLLAIAKRLAAVDAAEQARLTLLRAVAADPLNQAALTQLVELDLNLNRIDELPAHLRRLVTMRRPSPDVLLVAQHKLGSDLFLFSSERPAALEAIRVALEKSPPVPTRL